MGDFTGDRVREGMKELLQTLPEETLKRFLSTVTGQLVRFGSVPKDERGEPTMDNQTHAIHNIMMYSDPYQILGRKMMTRGVLSDYLSMKGYKMTMPPSKHSLCQDILRYWGVKIQPQSNSTGSEMETNGQMGNHIQGSSNISDSQNTSQSTTWTSREQPEIMSISMSGQSQTNFTNGPSGNALIQTNNLEMQSMEEENALARLREEREQQLGMQLGFEFSSWFYERLNTLTDFVPAHFWPECNLRIEMILASHAGNAIIDETLGNGELSCAKLKDLVVVKQLYFNPNRDTGIRGYLSPHGLAQVMVCGTLFSRANNDTVGVYEQMFGLMKDPRADNTFKIKFTILRLREGGSLAVQNSPPEMLDSSLVGIVEEIDDD